jgi:hypothetical protein
MIYLRIYYLLMMTWFGRKRWLSTRREKWKNKSVGIIFDPMIKGGWQLI